MMGTKNHSSISRREFIQLAAMATAAVSVDWTRVKALAAAIEPKKDLPVIVIGGGLGGLSAAAHLAQNGFPVTLIEQHDRPGGYATSFDRKGGRYTFDVSLHATVGANDGLKKSLEGAGVLEKVETVELPELCRIITPDHDLIWPQRNPTAIIKQLTQKFPGEAEGIQGFFDEILGVIDEVLKPFDRDSWWDLIRFPMTHKKMWGIRNKTLAQVLDQYTQNPKLRSILSTFWPYYGLPPCDPYKSGLGVTIYDNAFEGYSTPGTSIVQLLILSGYAPWKQYEDDYFAGRKKTYLKQKEQIAQVLIDMAEKRVIPGLSSMIEVMEAATPLTNVYYTRNPEGAIYGYEQAMNNAYMNRLQNTTPFKGLYLASAWSNPGGGFQPCLDSGAQAFTALVKDWGG